MSQHDSILTGKPHSKRQPHGHSIAFVGLKSFSFVGQLGSPGGVNSVSAKVKKPKVFVTEGKDVALTGVCVFFIRTNPARAITPENIHRVRGNSS